MAYTNHDVPFGLDPVPFDIEPVEVHADNWGWRHTTRKDFALRHVSFDIRPGERVLLLGASGAGKSTLMAAMAGVLGGEDEGTEEGHLTLDGEDARHCRGKAGLVLQDPDSQIIVERVGDDVAFGCENLGIAPEETWKRVRSSLDLVGLESLQLTHSTRHLSGGQRQRLALAGVLAMKPGLLLLDEPTANLDPAGARAIHDAVARIVESSGQTLVVVEHRIEVWRDVVDRVIVLGNPRGGHEGGVIADGSPDEIFSTMSDTLAEGGSWVPGRGIPSFPPRNVSEDAPVVLSAKDLAFGRGSALGEHLNYDFRPGQIYALMGPNGAGKSTLGLTLAGLLPPIGGRVEMRKDRAPASSQEPYRWKSKELLGRVGMVFQEPEHQFAATRVRDEVAIGPKTMGRSGKEAYAIADKLLEQLHLARFAQANPYTLSGGEKRRLSVASMLAAAPQVLIMDEPTFGQDFRTWTQLIRLIADIRDSGCTIILVTHDQELVQALEAIPLHFVVEGETR